MEQREGFSGFYPPLILLCITCATFEVAGWAMIWRGLWAMLMRVCSAVCVETCWSAPSRRHVNMPTAVPASAAGCSITTPVLKTGSHWMYMRNDLNRLQIRCVNAGQGCEVVCSLESLHTHEDDCEFAFITCSNTGNKSISWLRPGMLGVLYFDL
ncbi:uncharacterized protein LOC124865973 isoform X1 [Girardinichthys multiradiatus]|uniref:uncharacterized protein LOC124865973 isoform X1 n=1 Tax=Girardinichthys multiradiatus TaxID=208333 RepID=UPI001FADC6ED|nr:uncharacterized protein LOC124865973 isoform X1 [Girardinichthys multiradiatus]